MTTDAQAALAQVREALAAGPTPGPWSLKTVPTSDGSCHKIGPFPSASRIHSETHACVYAIGIRLGIDDSTPVARELLANARLMAACSPANVAAILAHVEAQAAENERLRKFVGRVLGEARQYMSDIDGGDVQTWAVECGLLEEWTASEPCGEQCGCAEVTDFPTRRYGLTETGKAAIDAAKEQQ